MWFMYVLSWLSLFIQVGFITLAVGESARPRSARAPTPASLLARARIAGCPESRGSLRGGPCLGLPARRLLPLSPGPAA